MKHQGDIGASVIDYEIPLCNRGTGLGKGAIDLAFRYKGDFYIIETKKEGSDESLLRCVLEIETYYETLNKNFEEPYKVSLEKVKKGILLFKESKGFRDYFDGKHDNVVKLMEKYEITLFELSYENDKFRVQKVK